MAKKKVSEVNKAVEAAERTKEQEVSKRLQEVLESEGYGLQPFIQYSEFGIVPRVRLVAIKTPDNADGQEDNPGDTGESQAEDTDTPTEQPQNA